MREVPERPLLRPWITLDPDPVLMFSDARGHVVRLRLDAVDLASLALSTAEALAALARRSLSASAVASID